jgi:hypothetical protein
MLALSSWMFTQASMAAGQERPRSSRCYAHSGCRQLAVAQARAARALPVSRATVLAAAPEPARSPENDEEASGNELSDSPADVESHAGSVAPSDADAGGFSIADLMQDSGSAAPAEAVPAPAATVVHGGYVFEEGRLFAKAFASERSGSYADSWTRAYLGIEARLGPVSRFRISAAGNVYGRAGVGGPNVLYALDLDEAYYSGAFGDVHVKFGSQIIAWGTMDSESPEDQFNPYDRRFLVGKGHEEGEERVAVLAARGMLPLGNGLRGEVVLIPFGQPDRGFSSGSNFAFARPGLISDLLQAYRGRVAREVAPAEQGPFQSLADTLETSLAVDPRLQARLPSVDAGVNASFFEQDPEGGIKLVGSSGVFEYGAAAMSVHERQPRIHISDDLKLVLLGASTDPSSLARLAANPLRQVATDYPRILLAGGDLRLRWDAFAFGLEIAYRDRATYYDLDLHPLDLPTLQAALHFEYLEGTELNLVLEGLLTHVASDEPLLFARRDNIRVSGKLQLSLLRDVVKLRVEAAYDIGYQDLFLAPEIDYDVSDRWSLSLGLVLFAGGSPALDLATLSDRVRRAAVEVGPFEYYRDQSFGSLKVKYGF